MQRETVTTSLVGPRVQVTLFVAHRRSRKEANSSSTSSCICAAKSLGLISISGQCLASHFAAKLACNGGANEEKCAENVQQGFGKMNRHDGLHMHLLLRLLLGDDCIDLSEDELEARIDR